MQRVTKESIFSDLNNVTVDTPLDLRFGEAFGFTESETVALANHVGMADRAQEMAEWYDGYCFGNTGVYNPWSTLNYLRDGIAQPYWTNTSGNAIVTNLIAGANGATEHDLRALAEGECVTHPIDLNTVFDDLAVNPDAMWSQLYLAGYLTTSDTSFPNDSTRERRLRVPNHEVRELYTKELLVRAARVSGGERVLRELHAACASGDVSRMDAILGSIVLDSPSFYDLADEGRCHMLLLAMLYGMPGYRPPESNRESGLGRSDILLRPDAAYASTLPAIVIEVKRARDTKDNDLEVGQLAAHARDVALAQALEREYGHGVEANGRLVWGVSFSGKLVRCACERVE